MDICVDIAAGLRLLGTPNAVTEDSFTKLLEAAICAIADDHKTTSVSHLCNSKGDAIKECYAALLSFLIEAARHDADPDTLSDALLQDYKFSAQRSEKLVGIYRQHKRKLQAALSHIGINPPHIIDASWTLDYCVKTTSLEQAGSFLYLIQFHTESCEEDCVRSLKFLCTQEELQDLVWKMRDAVRHVEKIANL